MVGVLDDNWIGSVGFYWMSDGHPISDIRSDWIFKNYIRSDRNWTSDFYWSVFLGSVGFNWIDFFLYTPTIHYLNYLSRLEMFISEKTKSSKNNKKLDIETIQGP